jgi:hypothetical protein
MSFNSNIIPGAAPLQWSNVYDAFTKINENFDILVATVGDGSGLTPIDFGTLDTNVSPTSTNVYKLGDGLHQWKAVHTAEWAETLGSETNGLWAGSAQIKGKGLIVDLPLGSTVDGDLIIDPDKTFFKSIQVNNDLSVEATEFGSAVNLLSGLGIDLSVSSGADSITIEVDPTFDLTGNVVADNGSILVNSTTGFLTGNVGVASEWRVTANSNTWKFRDDGVLQWPSLASFGDSGSSGDLLSAGAGNNLTLASEIDIVLITDSDGGGATWVFSSVGELTVPGPIISEFGGAPTISLESSVTGGAIRGEVGKTFKVSLSDGISSFPEWVFGADGELLFPGGQYVNASGFVGSTTGYHTGDIKGSVFGDDSTKIVDAVENKIYSTFYGNLTGNVLGNVTGNVLGNLTGDTTGYHTGDVKGSVFGDDSSILVDAISGYIYGNVSATTLRTAETKIALGNLAGQTSQGANSIAIGETAGRLTQGSMAVAVGDGAGLTTQGSGATALGRLAGNSNQGIGAVAVGFNSALTGQGERAVTIGYESGYLNQGTFAVAIGSDAGKTAQGTNAIAIGRQAGFSNQTAGSIVLNASGSALDAAAAGFFVNPVRNLTGASGVVQYNSTTSEISFSSALGSVSGTFSGNIFTNLIDSSDSSAITVTPAVVFNTQVTVEGTLTVNDGITGYISLAELKNVVAASADFSDFQIRMAAL